MRRTAGDGRWAHGTRWVALAALVVLLAGCAGGGGDAEDDGSADLPSSSASGDSGAGESSIADSTTTTAVGTQPEESVVEVPIESDLVERLPQFRGYERVVSSDPGFDERLCDGEKAPTLPVGQAEATYQLRPTEVLSIAGYRFPEGVASYYVSLYSDAVRGCAVAAGERQSLGLNEGSGFAYSLATERGDAFLVVALANDVMWVLFQERTDGPANVDESVLAAFARAIES